MRVGHALRRSGRPRRVDQADGVLGSDASPRRVKGLRVALDRRLPLVHELVPGQHAVRWPAVDKDDVAQVGGGAADGEELLQERLVLDESDGRLGVVGHVFDLLWRQRVVDADGRAAGMHDREVCDHVFGHVAGQDQPELAGAEAQLTDRQGHGGDLVAVLAPRELPPLTVPLPMQSRLVRPVPGGVGEDRADRLSGNCGVDIGSLSRYIHVIPPDPTILPRSRPAVQPRCAVLHYFVVGRD